MQVTFSSDLFFGILVDLLMFNCLYGYSIHKHDYVVIFLWMSCLWSVFGLQSEKQRLLRETLLPFRGWLFLQNFNYCRKFFHMPFVGYLPRCVSSCTSIFVWILFSFTYGQLSFKWLFYFCKFGCCSGENADFASSSVCHVFVK